MAQSLFCPSTMRSGMTSVTPKLGILGGTALLELPADQTQVFPRMTPFGLTSANPIVARLSTGHEVVLLPRHGQAHEYAPSQVNYRANIYALKSLGVTHILAFSAVGSLQAYIAPGEDIVIPDQLFDFTKGLRARTFFDTGLAVHVPMGEPFCTPWRETLIECARRCAPKQVHTKGTYVVIEGPQFSTAAESHFFRNTVPDATVIGMTALPEAALAREAGISYAVVAMPSDYDAWRDGEAVTADEVKSGLANFGSFTDNMVAQVLCVMDKLPPCECRKVLQGFAVHTAASARPDNDSNRILGVPFD